MINDPKSDPFNPITTSTFVCRIAIVTVDASTPTAVLHVIPIIIIIIIAYTNRSPSE